jgi:putative heme transporter
LPNAISAMLLYRLISWLLIAAIGWVVFFFMFRTENAADSDDDPITGPLPRVQLQSDHFADPTETALQGPVPPPEQIPPSDG